MPTQPNYNERLRSALGRIIRQASPSGRRSNDDAGKNRLKVKELLADARSAKEHGKIPAATIAYRQAVEVSAGSPRVLIQFAQFLIGQNRSDAAFELLGLALESDASNPDALEMYIEIVHKRDLDRNFIWAAMDAMPEALKFAPANHRSALDFAIPHSVGAAIEVLRQSPDKLVRAAIEINDAMSHDGAGPHDSSTPLFDSLTATEQWQVKAIVNLARGRTSAALEALEALETDDAPVASLRRAIRRARNSKKHKTAQKYIKAYLKYNPNDNWAKNQLILSKNEKYSNYALGKKGFPFPSNATLSAYESAEKNVFYLLHNSLPFNSAGYATRTHGLLRELNTSAWTVDGVTRLGYPYDMPGQDQLGPIPASDIVDGVTYRRLVAGEQIEAKNPIHSYVQRYSRALQDLALVEKPRIIHAASNHWNGLTAVTAARRLGIPSVYEVRGLWEVTRGSRNPEWAASNMYKFIARMEADAAKGATRVFTITNALKDEMISRGVDGEKIKVVPNGVDTTRFTPIRKDLSLAAELGLVGKTVIGYVGSILDYEGIELILEAAATLKEQREDFHVLIVGDGAELDRFKEFTLENSLGDVVTFTGRVPHEEVERYYSLIDIAPFPRLPLPVCEMVSPLKPFEAMAMGKAVIASDVAALKEIVEPGLNGLLHAKGNALSLTAAIEQLLDDPALLTKLGHQAREWVVENRDWSKLGNIISETYDELIELEKFTGKSK